jgi:hypothetical protein
MIEIEQARVIPAIASAASLVGATFVVVGQAVFDPLAATAERLIGGSVLLAAAWLIVRWTFRLLREAREFGAEDRRASIEREKLMLEQLAQATGQIAELNGQLVAERHLRISLERSGLSDRRIATEEG